MEAAAELEAALADAVRASLPLTASKRPAFISQYLIAILQKNTLPIAEGKREGTVESLSSELSELSVLLTNVVNSARDQPGWPLEAVATALMTSSTSTKNKARTNNEVKRNALTAALKIVEEDKARRAADGVADEPVSSLEIVRPCEERWGDREIGLMAQALERPCLDEELISLLATRQRLDDAKSADVCRDLDKALAVMGVSCDQYGLWREGDEETLDIDKKTGVMGSTLLVADPLAVTSLVLGTKEVRGGEGSTTQGALGQLLRRLPSLTSLSMANSCAFLNAVPDAIGQLRQLRHLDISGATRLPALPDAAMAELTELRSLDLTSCESLRALPASLASLTHLERLCVTQSHRDVEAALKAEEEAEDEGPNRRRVARAAIDGPGILSLPEALCSLVQLQHLTIGLPGLKALPPGFGKLSSLRTLSLAGSSGLTVLWGNSEAEECELSSLEYLELPDAPACKRLPEGVLAKLSKLSTLDLYGCTSMAALPDSISALTSLEELSIGSLEMTQLPASLCQLPGLKHLDLRLPALTSLPSELGSLQQLCSINVQHAAMAMLPASIGQLKSLRVLRLSRCGSLASLPDELAECTALELVELAQCTALAALPKGLGGLPSLYVLDFPGCDDLGDTLYDDPIVDELEPKGCGFFGPGIEIETVKYVEVKREVERAEEERKGKLAAMRA